MRKTTSYNEKMACNNVAAQSATAAGVPVESKGISLGEIALISLVSGAVATALGLGADLLKDWIKSPAKDKPKPAKE